MTFCAAVAEDISPAGCRFLHILASSINRHFPPPRHLALSFSFVYSVGFPYLTNNPPIMCSADIFLGVLAILFPPLPGMCSPPRGHRETRSIRRRTPRQKTNPPFPHKNCLVLLTRWPSLGQVRHLQRRLAHQHPALPPRLRPRPAARLVHHRQVPRAALRVRDAAPRRRRGLRPRHLRLRPAAPRRRPAPAAGPRRHELRRYQRRRRRLATAAAAARRDDDDEQQCRTF